MIGTLEKWKKLRSMANIYACKNLYELSELYEQTIVKYYVTDCKNNSKHLSFYF